jgi:hypothetical protein
MSTGSKRRWTIYVCPECDRVQGFGGRCRNAFAHEADERVMLDAVEVETVPKECGNTVFTIRCTQPRGHEGPCPHDDRLPNADGLV